MNRGAFRTALAFGGLLATACGGVAPGDLPGTGSGGPPLGGWAAGDGGRGGGSGDAGASPDAIATGGDASTPKPPPSHTDAGTGGSPDAGAPCYSEAYDPNASLSDLASGYSGNDWLSASLETMHRRYPTGYFVLGAMQSDPQLPQFVDASSWPALMTSMWSALNAETGGWDFDHASASSHPIVIVDTMTITVPVLTTWAQGEILQYITDTSTQTWDQAELQGQEGTYDGIFLFDDANSACTGLAASTAVGDQLTSPIPARDDVAAHLYYMELYLRAGRTAHATEYAALKTDASWQKLVRYEWARGHFWDAQARPNANLQNSAAPIWAHIDDPTNLDEIQLFTGQSPDVVACHP